jgi:type II secretory pathway component PulF
MFAILPIKRMVFFSEHVDDPTTGSFSPKVTKVFTWLFWILVIAVILCIVGFIVYKKQQEAARKRFF